MRVDDNLFTRRREKGNKKADGFQFWHFFIGRFQVTSWQ